MSRISIDIDQVQQANEGLAGSLISIQNARSVINSMSNTLSNDVLGRRGISGQIASILSSLDSLSSGLNQLLTTTTSGYTQYSDTEDFLYREGIRKLGFKEKSANAALFYEIVKEFKLSQGLFQPQTLSQAELNLLALFYSKFEKDQGKITNSTSVLAYIHNDMVYGFGNSSTTLEANKVAAAASLFQLVGSDFDYNALGFDFSTEKRKLELTGYGLKYVDDYGKEVFVLKSSLEAENTEKANRDILDGANRWAKGHGLRDEKSLYDYANNGMSYDEAKNIFSEKVGDLYEKTIGVSASVSLLEAAVSGDAGWGNYSANIKVANAEADASVSAGLYVVDKDGKQSFSPGVNAKAGASMSGFEAEIEGQLGNDMAGLYGEASVSALSAEAKAEVGIGKVDGKYELNASASAEAILAEAGVVGGVDILGGKIGGSANVNVGIGAKADIGYNDGVVKFNIGATLGVGFDVSLEADVGGMVDTISGAASSVYDGVSGAVSDFFDWAF